MSKIKIEIKNRFTGKILFEYEKESNTIKETLLEAVESRANLSGADLSGAYLSRANLSGADLYGADLSGANLSGANLSGADLYGADLSGANLSGADLSGAYLSRAYLSRANLSGANLSGAYLSRANLSGADLYGADLSGANLSGANLSGADLYGADLYGADLSGAKIEKEKFPLHKFNILPEGDIIGWKKVNGKIIKLLIPADAKRVHAISSRKCRAEFAKVLEIEGCTEIINVAWEHKCLYKVGEIVTPDKYNDCWLTECGNGINFFLNRQEAVEY